MPSKRQVNYLSKLAKASVDAASAYNRYMEKLKARCDHTNTGITKHGVCTFCGAIQVDGVFTKDLSKCNHPEHVYVMDLHHGYGRYVKCYQCVVCRKYRVWERGPWTDSVPSFRHDDD